MLTAKAFFTSGTALVKEVVQRRIGRWQTLGRKLSNGVACQIREEGEPLTEEQAKAILPLIKDKFSKYCFRIVPIHGIENMNRAVEHLPKFPDD